MDILNNTKDLSGAVKQKEEKRKSCLRFSLSLKTTKENDSPEFSYAELVKDATKKKQELTKLKDGSINDDARAKSEAESLARYYEEKYGGGGKGFKRKRDRVEDLADVGYGYDETDPFVDNSECYDEVVPSSMTTQYGGFYINSGKLEFKHVSDDSDVDADEDSLPLSTHLKKKRKKGIIFSDSDESMQVESNGIKKKKKIRKRASSMESEEKRRRKLSLQGKDKLVKLTKGSKKKSKVQLLVAKAKAQHHLNAADKLSASKQGHNSNSSHKPMNGTSQNTSMTETGRNLAEFLDNHEQDLRLVKSLSVDHDQHDSSSDELALSKVLKISDDAKLPHSIPSIIKDKITSLTKIAKSNEKEGKVKFFSADVNNLLLGIEAGSQALSNRERSGIYQHLTPHVPCSKDTLIKRMKKLHATKQDESVRQPLQLLKQAINESMEEQIGKYDEECAQQQARADDRVALAASTDEDEDTSGVAPSGEEKAKRVYAPRRKFKWTEKIRSLFFEVMKLKVNHFETLKNKQNNSAEEYLKNFLEAEVKGLWPRGWMQTRMLYKESRNIHHCITGHQPKQKKVIIAATKKASGNKLDKKIPTSSNHQQNNTSSSFSANSSFSSKPVIEESSMSINLSMNSDSSFDKASPSKQLIYANRSYSVTPKETALAKSTSSVDNAIKRNKVERDKCKKTVLLRLTDISKDSSISKDHPQSKSQPQALNFSENEKKSSKAKHLANSGAYKTVNAWVETGKSKPISTNTESVSNSFSYQIAGIKTDTMSSGQKSTTSSTTKSQQKKSLTKSTPKSSSNSVQSNPQLDIAAELLKFAMLSPSSGAHLPPSMYAGLLPTSNVSGSMENYLKLHPALQSQLQPPPDSMQAYLTGLSTGPLPTSSQYFSKTPKQSSSSTKAVSSASASSTPSIKKELKETAKSKHQRFQTYNPQTDSRKVSNTSRSDQGITVTAASERMKKQQFYSANKLAANHSSSASNFLDQSVRNSIQNKNSFSPAITEKASQPGRSFAAVVSTKKDISSPSQAFVPVYQSAKYPTTHYGNSEQFTPSVSFASSSYKLPDGDPIKDYRRKVLSESTSFVPMSLASDKNPLSLDPAAIESLLSGRNHLEAGNRR